MMSADEETEPDIQDLILQSLHASGSFSKLKAQARASVIIAMENENKAKGISPLISKNLSSFFKTTEASLAFSLVRDFLKHFNLEYAISVMDCETCEGDRWTIQSREKLINNLGLKDCPEPLLLQLIESRLYSQGTSTVPLQPQVSLTCESSQASDGDTTPKVTPREPQPVKQEPMRLSVMDLPPVDFKQKPLTSLPDIKPAERKMENLELKADHPIEEEESPASAGKLDITDLDEPMTDDIPEDLDADDLLNSSESWHDDLTDMSGVETVSSIGGKSNDYMENV